MWASPVALMVKNWLAMQETQDTGSVPGWEISPGGGHGNPLRYSCLDRGAWRAAVHGVAESDMADQA